LDVVFLLDATGSMADELNILQTGLDGIAAELTSLPNATTLRYGLVVYRDRAKSESVQLFSLTSDWIMFKASWMAVTAVGGGDYPENLSGGLYQAVTGMNWNPEAGQLLILLGDAPPRLDAESVPYDETMLIAAEQAITIFTVGSDGLNEAGAEIYQRIAEAGNGRFIFITNNPENTPTNVSLVRPDTDLPTLLVEIVREVLNEAAP
jgi:hypothetical protein